MTKDRAQYYNIQDTSVASAQRVKHQPLIKMTRPKNLGDYHNGRNRARKLPTNSGSIPFLSFRHCIAPACTVFRFRVFEGVQRSAAQQRQQRSQQPAQRSAAIKRKLPSPRTPKQGGDPLQNSLGVDNEGQEGGEEVSDRSHGTYC